LSHLELSVHDAVLQTHPGRLDIALVNLQNCCQLLHGDKRIEHGRQHRQEHLGPADGVKGGGG
jgi:hypothetical protein